MRLAEMEGIFPVEVLFRQEAEPIPLPFLERKVSQLSECGWVARQVPLSLRMPASVRPRDTKAISQTVPNEEGERRCRCAARRLAADVAAARLGPRYWQLSS